MYGFFNMISDRNWWINCVTYILSVYLSQYLEKLPEIVDCISEETTTTKKIKLAFLCMYFHFLREVRFLCFALNYNNS